jgi:sulfur dioxygenase
MPLFRQLFDTETSTFTYLIAEGKECILIDPVLEKVDRDLQLIQELGLELKYGFNTHCHADHITGTGKIKKRIPGFQSAISKASEAEADILLVPDQVFTLGMMEIKCLATTGHTNGCMSYYVPSLGAVFTGDALLIRGCGRTDFQEGSAANLYDNIHKLIFTLPKETKIYPGHDYRGHAQSTVEEEIKWNPRLTKSKEEFIKLMGNLGLPYPKKLDASLPANLKDGTGFE